MANIVRIQYMTDSVKNDVLHRSTSLSYRLDRASMVAFALLLGGCQIASPTNDTDTATPTPTQPAAEIKVDAAEVAMPVVAIEAPDLWTRVQKSLSIQFHTENHRVTQAVANLTNNNHYFTQISKRAEPYLYFILEEVDKRQVPVELIFVAIIESGFDPSAHSHAGASGLWQFMPATGKAYGLEQNWWYDGRRDVVASTRSALTYLEHLYDRFDDWELALAAFNAGQGRVRRAIQKNAAQGKSTRFWDLNLPKETMAYVPKMIALSVVIKDPAKYGIELPVIPNKPYFAEVPVADQLDLARAAELSGVAVDDLYRLNPDLNRWSTPPEGSHSLVVPVQNAAQFAQRLATLPPASRMAWDLYAVQSGDSLSEIAQRYHTNIESIAKANKLRNSVIKIGQTLMIPHALQPAKHMLSLAEKQQPEKAKSTTNRKEKRYTIRKGDSLWRIAKKYDVRVSDLRKWNNLSSQSVLKPGDRIKIWQTFAVTKSGDSLMQYTIRSGDTLSEIAEQHQVTTEQLKKWNQSLNKRYIQPGDVVTIYLSDATPAT